MKNRKPNLTEYFEKEFVPKMLKQMEEDQKKHGNTWLERPRNGQEQRIFLNIEQYFENYLAERDAMPWLKVVGLAVIAQSRLDHPGWFPKAKDE